MVNVSKHSVDVEGEIYTPQAESNNTVFFSMTSSLYKFQNHGYDT